LCESHGTIVNMASVAAWMPFPPIPGLAHSAAKGGVLAMTRHLVMEGREFSIRANTISSGPLANPTILSIAKENPKWDQLLRSKIMRDTHGTPEEIASVDRWRRGLACRAWQPP
jgi:NAD(P)-dependent dehydrogenase (short-subunit alcohol dehydrogenase family)